MAIEFYKEFGEFGYLANYSNHGFIKNGIYYKTVEHYYQSEKFDSWDIKKKIIEASTPKEASTIGRNRNLTRKKDFKSIKKDVMYIGVLEKFRQNPDIRSKLIETKNQEIREMTVKESFWGVGPNLDGENHIGKILMMVREQIKKEILNQTIEKCRNKKIFVLGHCNPDLDSVFSSLILTHILQSYGIDAVFSVRDENFIEERFIKDFLKEDYAVVKDYSDDYYLLVDHNQLDGISANKVIGAIDHHIITGEVENLIEMEYASCGLLLYDLFRNQYSFSKYEKELIGLTVLSDTEFLTSSRFFEEDQKLFEELDLSFDSKELQKRYFQITDFSDSVYSNLYKNYKEYFFQEKIIKRSMITSYLEEKNKYYNAYVLEAKKNDISLLIWCDYESKITYVSYKNCEFVFPYFTSSTNVVLKYLDKEMHLV